MCVPYIRSHTCKYCGCVMKIHTKVNSKKKRNCKFSIESRPDQTVENSFIVSLTIYPILQLIFMAPLRAI